MTLVHQWLDMYRMRESIFPHMEEPQWRMLLDLAANGPTTISKVGYASGRAFTTALRHTYILIEKGLIERLPEPDDGRKVIVRLTKLAEDKLVKFTAPTAAIGPVPNLRPIAAGFSQDFHAALGGSHNQGDPHAG